MAPAGEGLNLNHFNIGVVGDSIGCSFLVGRLKLLQIKMILENQGSHFRFFFLFYFFFKGMPSWSFVGSVVRYLYSVIFAVNIHKTHTHTTHVGNLSILHVAHEKTQLFIYLFVILGKTRL